MGHITKGTATHKVVHIKGVAAPLTRATSYQSVNVRAPEHACVTTTQNTAEVALHTTIGSEENKKKMDLLTSIYLVSLSSST